MSYAQPMIMGGGLVGGYGMGAGLVGGARRRRRVCRKACRRAANGRFVKCGTRKASFKICRTRVSLKRRRRRTRK